MVCLVFAMTYLSRYVSDIDSLVLSLATSVNTIHAGGMNQNNETGQDLFNLATTYKARIVGGTLDAGITAIANDNAATAVGSFSAQWSASRGDMVSNRYRHRNVKLG